MGYVSSLEGKNAAIFKKEKTTFHHLNLKHPICQEAINAKAADGDGPSTLFSQGRGHMLPGRRPEKQENQVESQMGC